VIVWPIEDPVTGIQIARSAAAERRARAFASGVVLDIADVPFSVKAEDISRATAVSSLLHGFPEHTDAPTAGIWFTIARPAVPDRRSDESYWDLRVWRSGNTLFLEHTSGVTARVDRETIRIGGDGHLGRAFRRMFLPAVTHLLGYRGLYVLHGGLVSEGGRAILVLGRTGSGKSTLAAAAFERGWAVHTDDMAVLRSNGESVDACGLPRPLAIPAYGRPTGSTGDDHVTDARGRTELDPGVLERGWRPLEGVLQVGHASTGGASLEPMPATAVVRALVGSFPSAANPDLCRPFLSVAASAARRPGWYLHHARERGTRVAQAAQALDAVAAKLRDVRR
jgi:hypothetical protein